MGIFDHERTTAKTHVWLTPKSVIEDLGPFDLDPCAATDRPFDCAENNYIEELDGLSLEWRGFVWCNPPYGRYIDRWLERMIEHSNGIALVFARTDTKAMQNALKACDAVLFVSGRIRFLRENGVASRTTSGGAGGAPSMLLAYGPLAVKRLGRSRIPGVFFEAYGTRQYREASS
jgi:hypothetical protein